jgi:hypothetical protein
MLCRSFRSFRVKKNCCLILVTPAKLNVAVSRKCLFIPTHCMTSLPRGITRISYFTKLLLYKLGQALRNEGGWGIWSLQNCYSPVHLPLSPPEISLVIISVRSLVEPMAIVRPEGLSDSIDNRTRDISAYSAVSQPTPLQRNPLTWQKQTKSQILISNRISSEMRNGIRRKWRTRLVRE